MSFPVHSPALLRTTISRIYLLPTAMKFGSRKLQRFVVDFLPWKNLQRLRDISDVMHRTSVEIFEGKKAAMKLGDEALEKQVGQGKDLISILSKYICRLA